MIDKFRVVRYYKPRFVSTTEGAILNKDFTRTDIQILIESESGSEWKSLPVIDIEEGQ